MSDTNLGRAILEISTKDTDAKAGLNKFKADAESTLKQIQASFDKLGKSLSTSLNSSVGQLHSSLAKLESSGKSAAAGLKTLETGSSAAEKAAGNLHKTAITAGSGLQNLSTGASNAGGAILRLGSGAIGVAASGLEKIGSVAIAAGAALTKLGLVGGVAFAGLATLGVKSAGDLQEAVNNWLAWLAIIVNEIMEVCNTFKLVHHEDEVKKIKFQHTIAFIKKNDLGQYILEISCRKKDWCKGQTKLIIFPNQVREWVLSGDAIPVLEKSDIPKKVCEVEDKTSVLKEQVEAWERSGEATPIRQVSGLYVLAS
jgi:hypothetical protein